MALDLVVGTNTYLSLEDADTYFEGRLHADAWEAASEADRAKALVTATRAVDRQRLRGRKADADQSLQFPRAYPGAGATGSWIGNLAEAEDYGWIAETGVPQAVKDAVCEEALFLLSMTSWDRKREKAHALGVVGGSVGDANEYAQETVVREKAQGGQTLMSPAARQLMAPYLARTAGTV